jgi:hypothetical protein
MGKGRVSPLWGLELWGIDDPDLVLSIRRRCLYGSKTLGSVGLVFIATSALVGIIGGLMSEVLGRAGLVAWLLSSFLGTWVLLEYWRRAAMRALPGILREMGRCEKCGYDMQGHVAEPCPECGCARSEEGTRVDKHQ